jgi:hypothetical protein
MRATTYEPYPNENEVPLNLILKFCSCCAGFGYLKFCNAAYTTPFQARVNEIKN